MIPKAQQRRMTAVEDNRLRTEKFSGRHRFIGSYALVTTVCSGTNRSRAGVLIRKHASSAGTSLLRHVLLPRPHRADDVEGR